MRYLFALVTTVLASIFWYLSDAESLVSISNWLLLAYAISGLLILPVPLGIFSGLLLCIVLIGLYAINWMKLKLTYMPLTVLDLKIAYNNPVGFLSAIDVGIWALILLYFIIACLGLSAMVLLYRSISTKSLNRPSIVAAVAGLFIFSFSAFMTWQIALDLNSSAKTLEGWDDNWKPKGVMKMSQSAGLVPFLIISFFQEAANPVYSHDSGSFNFTHPSKSELTTSIETYVPQVKNYTVASISKPNIVVILAESTLNPNKTFRLSNLVSAAMFSLHPDTRIFGQSIVNAVGGGTWISEFESITGLDSRFFGYAGFYTHVSLSPYIKQTLATYLEKKGYRTLAFYGTRGKFYGARYAYSNYGFGTFYDSKDLGAEGNDWIRSDRDLISIAISKLGPEPKDPFFAYIVTAGNHAPHNCKHFASEQEFVTTLLGSQDFEINCQLNEYIRRLRSTDSAFETMVKYLQSLDDNTGRPYVLLLIGDHQPHTFVYPDSPVYRDSPKYLDFSDYRTKASKYETVFHLRSNAPGRRITWGDHPLPLTLVPTVLSTFVASDIDDLYLGINFYLVDKCGPDFFPGSKTTGFRAESETQDRPESKTQGASASCKEARQSAYAYYQRQGYFVKKPNKSALP